MPETRPAATIVKPTTPEAPVAEPMYEVVTDTWGARAPVYHKGDTLVPSMLPPDRDLSWAERMLVVSRLDDNDARTKLPPTGPSGNAEGVPADGWYSPSAPQHVPEQAVPGIVAAMRAAGASEAMIAAVRAQPTGTVPAPGQPHIEAATTLDSSPPPPPAAR